MKPENGANLLVNNMLFFSISRERLLEQSYNDDDPTFHKFIKRYSVGFRRSSSFANMNSFQSGKHKTNKDLTLVYLCTENEKIYC
jgi:hypothetical protein